MYGKRKAQTENAVPFNNNLSDPDEVEKKLKKQRDCPHPLDDLKHKAEQFGCELWSRQFAKKMDEKDPLAALRDDFFHPKMSEIPMADLSLVNGDDDCIYFSGNSLGLQPKSVGHYVNRELERWAKIGVHGYLMGQPPWKESEEVLLKDMAVIVGAEEDEVALMNSLTVNLHLLLVSFYRPTAKRHKIMIESKAFPSDQFTVESQITLHGYDPATSLICVEPREGEHTIRTEDILSIIEQEGDSIAVIMFSGLQYYTGQVFDMARITQAGHAKGCFVGFDLAHAVGNVKMHLHDWNVDFAAWCNYKYLNSGAGSMAGAFMHSRHAHTMKPRLVGWWSHRKETRLNMSHKLDLTPGIAGYRMSTPSFMAVIPIKASLDVFRKTSMSEIRAKSLLLTGYLEYLIDLHFGRTSPKRKTKEYITLLTPKDPEQRGAQLSLSFSVDIAKIHMEIMKRGIACDERKPDVIRVAPAPLYCKFHDVWRFVNTLQDILETDNFSADSTDTSHESSQ